MQVDLLTNCYISASTPPLIATRLYGQFPFGVTELSPIIRLSAKIAQTYAGPRTALLKTPGPETGHNVYA